MKRFRFYAILIAMVTFVACSDDFVPVLVTDLETDTFEFSSEGGEQTFMLESNEEWMVGELPDWLTVSVVDAPATRVESVSYEKGKKAVTIVAKENIDNKERTTEFIMKSVSGEMVKLTIVQKKQGELTGYWILSEGHAGSNNSEMAWFDVSTDKVDKKQFNAINGKPLGDTGNALKMYGSKMYALVSGTGFGAGTSAGTSYIEVINPKDGKSIKRIQFTDAAGDNAKPRSIIFEGGKGYVSSYSNELVRLDTATLELDARAALGGTLAEGLAYNNGNVYVCNSGQGQDNKISVVDVATMKETKVITTAMNPTGIVSASNGVLYFNTNYPEYTLYKLVVDGEKITEMPDVSAADMTYTNNHIYTSTFSWDTYMGEVWQFNTTTEKATELNLDLAGAGIPMLMEYHIGTINGSDHLYLTGMGEDVVIFDPSTKAIKHALQTGVPNATGVVAVYK